MPNSERSVFQTVSVLVGSLLGITWSGFLVALTYWESTGYHTDSYPLTVVLPAIGTALFPVLGALVAAPIRFYRNKGLCLVGAVCATLLCLLGLLAILFAYITALITDYDPGFRCAAAAVASLLGIAALASSAVLFKKV